MITFNPIQLEIINHIKDRGAVSFSEIFAQLTTAVSERTVKRYLTELAERNILATVGGGRSLTYTLPPHGRFFVPIDVQAYTVQEPDKKTGVLSSYQFDTFSDRPDTFFSADELQVLHDATTLYQTKTTAQSEDIKARELERFVIELSWKSSRIEGNTYTLLDTERLIKEGIPSATNTQEETVMILNHKKAFDFVRENTQSFTNGLTASYVEKVHSLLMDGLLTDTGLRKHGVGITGSGYRPLDNQFQIGEALTSCITSINTCNTVYDKALLTLIGISYIQPFVDGNKRTARLVANGILLTEQASPLSYRNVDETIYRASLLAFYEQLSAMPMKDLFIEQYLFAARQYS